MSSRTHDRTLAFAAVALSKIVELELPADPQSFELWYTYATGQNQKLNDEIDDLLKRQGKMTSNDLARLHTDYISSARTTSSLNAFANKLTDEVGQVVGMIDAAVSSVERYDEKLNVGAAAADGAGNEVELKRVVEELISATKTVERENYALREQLESAKERSEELKHDIELIRLESLTDPLTQIGNRQYFDEALSRAIARASETAVPLSLLLVDIDHFKKFNDDFGHLVGDDVLRLVAARLKSSVRDGEIARYGGEEFGVILSNKSLEIGKLIAERARLAVESSEMKDRSTGASLGCVTVSVGVAQFRQNGTAEDLIRRADEALYAAKRNRRNCVVVDNAIEPAVSRNRAAGY